jgi:hypothetical protein
VLTFLIFLVRTVLRVEFGEKAEKRVESKVRVLGFFGLSGAGFI